MTKTMNIVQQHEFGAPEVLRFETAAVPGIAPDEVLVRVHAAGINPVDAKTRQGKGVAGRLGGFPITPGWDLSGVVEAVGPEVTRFKPGDAVYGMPRFPGSAAAYAEFVAAQAAELALKPSSLSHVEAAALPLAALTAEQAFDLAGLSAGQRVLIHAAAGGVGHLAVQLARARGAFVIGTAGPKNLEFLRSLGVDQIVDYTAEPFENVVSEVDLALNTVGPEVLERSWGVVRRGGWVVSILGLQSPELGAARGVRGEAILVHPDGAMLARFAALADAGHLRPHVSLILPLERAPEAHHAIESGRTRGKIVLENQG